eukprot:NODE_710_length_655_cov_259.609848_g701_i0.p1 GENE.NODE_710_length_655_cov_259.609848_g701_i0~~NODE_710_length_655_cov_259.609848_g701_i0.p1  ORF type:complete len:143 (+),score=52.26 NODE_710_length_655_cov_259.609848_g701_i0:54-431(+)
MSMSNTVHAQAPPPPPPPRTQPPPRPTLTFTYPSTVGTTPTQTPPAPSPSALNTPPAPFTNNTLYIPSPTNSLRSMSTGSHNWVSWSDNTYPSYTEPSLMPPTDELTAMNSSDSLSFNTSDYFVR